MNRLTSRIKWYHKKGWRATALLLAAAIVFSTTYALILPAITLEEEVAQEDAAIFLEQEAVPEEVPADVAGEDGAGEAVTLSAGESADGETPSGDGETLDGEAALADSEVVDGEAAGSEAAGSETADGEVVDGETDGETDESDTESDLSVQSFRGSFLGVTVLAEAEEGTFPDGSAMQVTEASEEAVASAAALLSEDTPERVGLAIRFTDAEGAPVQPQEAVCVTLCSGIIQEGQPVAVIRANESGATALVQSAEWPNAGSVSFTVTGDGEYVLAGVPAPVKDEADAEETEETETDAEETEEETGDRTADLETAEDWEATLDVYLTGNWHRDLVAVARTQLGYQASSKNFVTVDGVRKGYTRYGAWYGYPYSDWCASFVSFCLNYANIPNTKMPYHCSVWQMMGALKAKEMYAEAADYVPVAGDLIFFNTDLDVGGIGDHVGIVSGVSGGTVYTIEGNHGAAVAEFTYDLSDETILGYGVLPEKPEMPAQDFEGSVGGVLVTVKAEAGAFPAGTTMALKLVTDEEVLSSIESAVFGGVTEVKAVDITFYDADGAEIEPEQAIHVSMRDEFVKTAENVEVVHVDGDNNATVVAQKDEETEDDEITFESANFSTYALVSTITLQVITASGETYEISVAYDEESGIPDDATLYAEEIPEDSELYWEYYWQAAEAMNSPGGLSHARFFDVKILVDGEPREPGNTVITTIKYVDGTDAPLADGPVKAIHFTDEGDVEVIDTRASEDGTEITFRQEGFSVTGTARSNVGAGDFIIYRDNNSGSDYAMQWNFGRGAVTVSGGMVTSQNDNVVWTFTQVTGGYRISYTQNGTTYYLRDNNGTLTTTTTANQASTWSYSGNRLSTRTGNTTRYIRYNNNSNFTLTTSNSAGERTLYLAAVQEPVTIRVHYVLEDGTPLLDEPIELPASTNTSANVVNDIVQTFAGRTYHNTYIGEDRAVQIVPELHGASGGAWEYQTYGHATYTKITEDTDIYVVYGGAYGGGGGSGSSGGGDELEIDVPSTGKDVTANSDGTFNLSLTITGEGDTQDDQRGANVILVLDISTSMDYPKSPMVSYNNTQMSRLNAAKLIAQSFATKLLGMNADLDPEDEPLVEMALLPFGGSGHSPSTWYSVAGELSGGNNPTYPEGTFNRLVADLGTESGTNWEDALSKARLAAANHNDGDATYIIFVTDGNPSWSSEYDYGPEATAETGTNYYRTHAGYMNATDEARAIVQDNYEFYTIGMFGNVSVLEYLTNFAFTGRSQGTQTQSGHYFPASSANTLLSRMNDIADVISNSLALAGVEFNDGVAKDVTHTALTTNVTGRPGGVTYSKTGGTSPSYSVTVDTNGAATFHFGSDTRPGSITTIDYNEIVESGGTITTQPAQAQVYTATYGDTTYYMPIASYSDAGDFQWDLSPLGTLEKNGKYTVSFTVWPDQDAYDYVTNLNNNIPGYTWSDADAEAVYASNGTTVVYYRNGVSQYPNIVKYPNGTFAAMSNTYQTVDYYIAKEVESGGTTTTTYEAGVPIDMDVPEPMVLTGSSFKVTKRWDDSLDQSQLAYLIANAQAHGETYSVTLNLFEDGEFYKSYTFEPVYNEETEEYEWPSQTINIAPALLTPNYPGGGTYKTVTIDNVLYYVLNEGHQYLLEETNTNYHFEFNTQTYHPALINGVMKNVKFTLDASGNIVDGSTAEVVGTVPLVDFVGVNTLRGGINIHKRVAEEDGTVVEDNEDIFKVKVTLTVPRKADGSLDFSHVENYVDYSTGQVIEPYVAWFKYVGIDDDGNEYDVVKTGEEGDPLDFVGTDFWDSGAYFYLTFDENTGSGELEIPITAAYSLRFVNMPAGTGYEVEETDSRGMQASYEYWHDNIDSTAHMVIGNAGSNVRVTNTILNRFVIVKKTDMAGTTLLGDTSFTLNGETLTTANTGDTLGFTEAVEIPISAEAYDLIETVPPVGYIPLTSPVQITVAASGVTYIQSDYNNGAAQTAEQDEDGNYIIWVRDNPGTVLPNTGGAGTTAYFATGLILTALALGAGIWMRRRERRYE